MPKTPTSCLGLSWDLLGLAIVSLTVLAIPDLYAQILPQDLAKDSDIGNFICWVADNFEGNAGRGIATIGISVIGILALIGRITWTQAIIVGVGCAVIFGAPVIITEVTPFARECNF